MNGWLQKRHHSHSPGVKTLPPAPEPGGFPECSRGLRSNATTPPVINRTTPACPRDARPARIHHPHLQTDLSLHGPIPPGSALFGHAFPPSANHRQTPTFHPHLRQSAASGDNPPTAPQVWTHTTSQRPVAHFILERSNRPLFPSRFWLHFPPPLPLPRLREFHAKMREFHASAIFVK